MNPLDALDVYEGDAAALITKPNAHGVDEAYTRICMR